MLPGTLLIREGDSSILWEVCKAKGMTSVGSQAVAVKASSGTREMSAMGCPGLWLEDFGSRIPGTRGDAGQLTSLRQL